VEARPELEAQAARIRGRIIELSHMAGAPHLGSSLSTVDILVALYWDVLRIDPRRPGDPGRDRCILSKGHAAPALYVALAQRGFFPEDLLESFGRPGGRLPEQPSPGGVPGVEVATGSLGHGLPIALGMALAGRLHRRDYRVYVVLSDGECNEGSVWEAAMTATARGLDNVLAVVDFNRWQATGRSTEVLALEPLADKFAASGWVTHEVDGHDIGALSDILRRVPDGSGRPVAVIANTVKGKGVSFMEDDNNWHYRIPSAEEVRAAHAELGLVPTA
jgi:transketolase